MIVISPVLQSTSAKKETHDEGNMEEGAAEGGKKSVEGGKRSRVAPEASDEA